ncbi:MAG: hypothetical protein E7545_01250 [Ruminococcaceae bacterium]|nr:hypothetical protein [Oscillospiraceae bacterium]
MWEIDNSFQLFSFLVSICAGIIYCLIYDFLRAFRKIKAVDDLTVFFQDLIYFAVIGVATFVLFMALSNGEIRGYILIGIFMGFILCFCTLSRFFVWLLCKLFKLVWKINGIVIDNINRFLDFIGTILTKWVKKLFEILAKLKNIKKPLEKSG